MGRGRGRGRGFDRNCARTSRLTERRAMPCHEQEKNQGAQVQSFDKAIHSGPVLQTLHEASSFVKMAKSMSVQNFHIVLDQFIFQVRRTAVQVLKQVYGETTRNSTRIAAYA
jgi:hypothetical protein